jgi:hypothetical protein
MLALLTFLQTIDLFSAHFSVTNGRSGQPYVNVVIPQSINPKIGNDILTIGDEIGVFDSQGNCWGFVVWNNANTQITVFGNDPGIDTLGMPTNPGMPNNEAFKYRIWDSETSKEYSSVSAAPVVQYNSSMTFGILTSLNALSAPVITNPLNNSTGVSAIGDITWNATAGAAGYDYVLSINPNYSSPILNSTTSNISVPYSNLSGLKKYYLKVRGVYPEGNGPFTEIQFTTTFSISLNKGWNIISSYYLPDTPDDMVSIFNTIVDKVLIVKNSNGAAYIPQWEDNQIGSWDVTQGYLIYMNEASTLSISGAPVNPTQTQIALIKGWNIISYLRDSEIPCETAFAGLKENNLLIVKNNNGAAYIPQWEDNQIGNLIPGQGYLIYVSENDVLVYPGN